MKMSEKFKIEEEDERTIPHQSIGEGECPGDIQVIEPQSGWVARRRSHSYVEERPPKHWGRRYWILQPFVIKRGFRSGLMYYDYSKMAVDYNLVRPVFGVDTEFYRTNLTDRYMKRFRENLFNGELMEEEKPRFVLFHSDSLIATSQDLEELEIQ